MALLDHFENATLLWRTVRGTFDFTGRARRTELCWWWLGYFVVNLLFESVIADRLSPWRNFLVAEGLLLLFLFFVVLALMGAPETIDADRYGLDPREGA